MAFYSRNHDLPSTLVTAVLALSTFAVSGTPASGANQTIQSTSQQSKFLTGTVSQNELIDNLERMGIKCILQGGATERLLVDQVRMGSGAYYAGISKGDAITGLKKTGADMFCVTIERAGKTYQSNLKALSGQIASSSLQTGVEKTLLQGNAADQLLKSGATEQLLKPGEADQLLKSGASKNPEPEPEKKLVPYDVELIIDITGSMNEVDGTGNLSKFDWCHEQVRGLAGRLNPYHKTLTITTFNNTFQTRDNCTPEEVENIYASIHPRGGTDLVDPLEARLDAALAKHRASKRPVLIAVITDGEPNIPRDPHVVNQAIIAATQRMNDPDEVVVTFLQIGDTFVGQNFCLDLDNNLLSEGARYDIVDTKTFAELKSEGLVDALVDAIVESKNSHSQKGNVHIGRSANHSRPAGPLSKNASKQLEDLQKQRQDIEKQLLGK
jgi:hypothetical protein